MQSVAAHAHPDGGMEPVDQFELQHRRRGGPGTGPVYGDAARRLRRAPASGRPDECRAETTRARSSAAPAAGTIVNAREADHGRFDVAIAARIEQRRAGRAAGAPVFGNAIIGREAEAVVKLPIVEFAQRFLVEDRQLAPLVRIVEPIPASRGRACPGRTARGAPARPRASCLRIGCAQSRPVFFGSSASGVIAIRMRRPAGRRSSGC